MRKTKKIMLMILTVLLALQAIAGNASAATIYVEPGDSIQKAVDNARSGDTIVVKPGTYAGGIKVSTADLTIMSSSPHKAIIKAENNAFDVYESNVVIKNFDIRGPGKSSGVCFSFSRTEDWSATAGAFACTVQNNKISNFSTGASVGFYMHSGSENILNNDISNCGTGISVFDIMSETVTISGNRIINCDNGLFLVDAFCIITNNNFNNTVNVNSPEGTGSIFNTTKTVGINIVGGPYLGGNYWATPSGNGFSQTHYDNNGDGFADEPYRLDDSGSVDYLPLIPLKSSVAAFSASPTSGKAPLKVKFTDKKISNTAGSDTTTKSNIKVTEGAQELKITNNNLLVLQQGKWVKYGSTGSELFELQRGDFATHPILYFPDVPSKHQKLVMVGDTKALTMTDYAGSSGYWGECVSFAKALSGSTVQTSKWIRGQNVVFSGNVKPGTVIATFDEIIDENTKEVTYKYRGHTAIFREYIKDSKSKITGIKVWDQNWVGRPTHKGLVGRHNITSGIDKNRTTHFATNYYIVQI